MIVGYYNHLIDLGVAGFRVDASKHMWPADLAAIQGATKDTQFGGRPFYMHEVIDQNDGAVRVGVSRVWRLTFMNIKLKMLPIEGCTGYVHNSFGKKDGPGTWRPRANTQDRCYRFKKKKKE